MTDRLTGKVAFIAVDIAGELPTPAHYPPDVTRVNDV